jgi:Ca2+-binding RTX toxin-like protein
LGNSSSDIFNQVMGNGDDTLDGGAGNDSIMGGFGNDLIIGGSGNDTLWGRGGTNTITKYAYSYVDGTAALPESASFIFMPSESLTAGNTLSVAGLTITAVRDMTGQELANALSSISAGGTGTSSAGIYLISGNLTSGWKSNAVTNQSGSGSAAFYTVKFQTSSNRNVPTNPLEMTAAKTTLNMSDNDTFKWNSGDASLGSVTTDTIKDFSAWDPITSKGDKIDISDLLRGLGYQAGTSTLSDWVSFTAANGNTAARIDIDTGANPSVVQTIVLENANMNVNTTLQQLINNGVLVA